MSHPGKVIAMLGTSLNTMGGISAVVNVYVSAGLFEKSPIIYIPTHLDGGLFKKLGILLRSLSRFLNLLILGRIKLIHVHAASRASFWRKSLFLVPAFLINIPVVLHLHGAEFAIFYEKECGNWRKRFIRYVFDKSSRVVVLSSAWKVWVQGMSRNPHVVAIYNPVLLPETMQPWSMRQHGVILSLGRLGKRKGSYDLLDAAAKLSKTQLDLRLMLGGDGELDQVRSHANKLGIGDKVELLGWVRGADKLRYLSEACVYALPSYAEGLPMSVLEAMAAGLPILSTPVGGIPEAVTDGVEGFLVQPGDVAAIADRLDRLLSEAGLAERMGTAARLKVETTFSAEAILPQIEQIYKELGAVC